MSGELTFSGWESMVQSSASGELVIDYETATGCFAACEELISTLESVASNLFMLNAVSNPFGGLPSGDALFKKFSDKATAKTDSLDKSLKSHIEVLALMRQVFKNSIDSYWAQDSMSAHRISELGN